MMTDQLTLTLNSPITEEQWDDITDVDFDHTDRIMFHTKHGKEVKFVKRKRGHWIDEGVYADGHNIHAYRCSECGGHILEYDADPFCRWCGADMRGEQE